MVTPARGLTADDKAAVVGRRCSAVVLDTGLQQGPQRMACTREQTKEQS